MGCADEHESRDGVFVIERRWVAVPIEGLLELASPDQGGQERDVYVGGRRSELECAQQVLFCATGVATGQQDFTEHRASGCMVGARSADS